MPTFNIAVRQAEIAEFCRSDDIRKLSLFGSVLRDDLGPDSDVDVLMEFEEGRHVGLITLAALEVELSGMLDRQVDLRTPNDLSRYFRDEVLACAAVRYAAC